MTLSFARQQRTRDAERFFLVSLLIPHRRRASADRRVAAGGLYLARQLEEDPAPIMGEIKLGSADAVIGEVEETRVGACGVQRIGNLAALGERFRFYSERFDLQRAA